MSAPLLFLGHAADRTGPPIYLLHLLRWLRANRPEVDFEVALMAGGALEDEFRALAPTSTYRGLPPSRWDAAERAMLLADLEHQDDWWALRRQRQMEYQMLQHADCRVVYVNGAPAVELARALPPGDRVQLSHVHELEIGLTHLRSDDELHSLLDDATRIFVVADAVGDNLVVRHGVDRAKVAVHRGMVDLAALGSHPAADRTAVRRAHGLPEQGPVVGTSGTLDWRKAVDLFVRAAWTMARTPRPEPITFVWVGGAPEAIRRAEAEAAVVGLADRVRFVGVQSDPLEWFACFDVFLLPSREDPFPLVCLEAAAVGCPVVAFDAGGIPELLVRGCGLVASYPDVDELAGHATGLLDDEGARRAMGERGRELMRAEHDVSVLAPRLWADIERWLP